MENTEILLQHIKSLETMVLDLQNQNNQILELLTKRKPTKTEPAKVTKPIEERVEEFKQLCWVTFKDNNTIATIKEFFEYWSELNKSGTKMRWESEKFFDLNRRMVTWLKNSKKVMTPATSGVSGFTIAN